MGMHKFFSRSYLTTQQVATHEQFLNQMYATWCAFVHDMCVSLHLCVHPQGHINNKNFKYEINNLSCTAVELFNFF